MCGHFARTRPVDDFAKDFSAKVIAALPPAYNVAPIQDTLAAQLLTTMGRAQSISSKSANCECSYNIVHALPVNYRLVY